MGLKKHGGGVLTTKCDSNYIKLSPFGNTSQQISFPTEILVTQRFFHDKVLLNSTYINVRCVI